MIELDVDALEEPNFKLPPKTTFKNVHTEHCCIYHGCKYGDQDCIVYLGISRQSYACESCQDFNDGKISSVLKVEIKTRRDIARDLFSQF